MGIAGHCGQIKGAFADQNTVQGAHPGTVMAAWLHTWALNKRSPNPPNAAAYHIGIEHVRSYALEMAYIPPLRPNDTPRLWRKSIFWVLHTMVVAASPVRPLRIVTMHPHYDWSRIWQNLHSAWIPAAFRSTWYTVLQDKLPTNNRLNRIVLFDSDRRNFCGQTDSLFHCILECGTGLDMWRWTRVRLSTTFRINACHIPSD